ncbi:MBL fold metallo-hydrolase [Candidatus Pacearchaeota archaeon]|nr:MBL fold metallo-hydrolase [Candidatus Pacearchaeota archaeon]MBI4157115.1 MBL fold metallo-hydrolase [Candidatus Woesearchaeota archaeon]
MKSIQVKDVKIEWLGHSGFLITSQDGKRIAIDPFNINSGIDPVDMILITHPHYDHCSIKDIQLLVKEGTSVVVPIGAQSKINKIEGINIQLSQVGLKMKVQGINIYPFPAYNIDKEFHPKEEDWMGYMLKLNDVIIYHSGDTDNIPEMNNLVYIAQEGEEVVLLLPVSGVYVMNAKEAVSVAEIIKPALAIPMHYGSVAGTEADAKKFVELCKEKGIRAEILEKLNG